MYALNLQVGSFSLIHRDDLRVIAPQWLQMTVNVREDKEVGGFYKRVLVQHSASSGQCFISGPGIIMFT